MVALEMRMSTFEPASDNQPARPKPMRLAAKIAYKQAQLAQSRGRTPNVDPKIFSEQSVVRTAEEVAGQQVAQEYVDRYYFQIRALRSIVQTYYNEGSERELSKEERQLRDSLADEIMDKSDLTLSPTRGWLCEIGRDFTLSGLHSHNPPEHAGKPRVKGFFFSTEYQGLQMEKPVRFEFVQVDRDRNGGLWDNMDPLQRKNFIRDFDRRKHGDMLPMNEFTGKYEPCFTVFISDTPGADSFQVEEIVAVRHLRCQPHQ